MKNSPLLLRRMQLTESSATVLVERVLGDETRAPAGTIRGPFCEFARTLPADFPLRDLPPLPGRAPATSATIVDPCYWTPALPFEYELRPADGASPRRFALRRWYAVGASFRLSGRRTVLRGAAVDSVTESALAVARASAAVLCVPTPAAELCERADRIGVALVADLRGATDARDWWQAAGWRGSVVAALTDESQAVALGPLARATGIALAVGIAAEAPALSAAVLDECDAVAVELQPGQRPPTWAGTCGKPVVAIRRGDAAPDLAVARAAADALQAELAPQFNLAGYFVAARPS